MDKAKNNAKKSKIQSSALVDQAAKTTLQKIKIMQKQSIAFVGQTRKTIPQKKLKKVKKQSIALVGQTTKAILVKDSVNRKEKLTEKM